MTGFTDIESIIEAAIKGKIDAKKFCDFCHERTIKYNDLCNHIALTIAGRFDSSQISYDDADAAMNHVWSLMIVYLSNGPDSELAEPAYTIYEAFDAGEYGRGDGKDPVQTYTVPFVKKILADHAQEHT